MTGRAFDGAFPEPPKSGMAGELFQALNRMATREHSNAAAILALMILLADDQEAEAIRQCEFFDRVTASMQVALDAVAELFKSMRWN